MMKLEVKFFGSPDPLKKTFSGKETFFTAIQNEINTWLAGHPDIEIVEIKQSAAGGSWASSKLFVSVWYRKKSQNT